VSVRVDEAIINERRPDVPFEEPWQARAFALAVAATEGSGRPWEDFRTHLIAAIEADPERPYYDSWLGALEAFVATL
jgi:nitrile hydratase accessory protein